MLGCGSGLARALQPARKGRLRREQERTAGAISGGSYGATQYQRPASTRRWLLARSKRPIGVASLVLVCSAYSRIGAEPAVKSKCRFPCTFACMPACGCHRKPAQGKNKAHLHASSDVNTSYRVIKILRYRFYRWEIPAVPREDATLTSADSSVIIG